MLKNIKSRLEIDILIQLHPRAIKERSSKYYNFKISDRDLASQIRNADIVIGHCTTALQLAILYQKPIILLRTKGWKINGDLYIWTRAYSKALKIPIYTSKTLKNLKEFPKINYECYKTFVKNYIKFPGTEENFSWNIISNELKKI